MLAGIQNKNGKFPGSVKAILGVTENKNIVLHRQFFFFLMPFWVGTEHLDFLAEWNSLKKNPSVHVFWTYMLFPLGNSNHAECNLSITTWSIGAQNGHCQRPGQNTKISASCSVHPGRFGAWVPWIAVLVLCFVSSRFWNGEGCQKLLPLWLWTCFPYEETAFSGWWLGIYGICFLADTGEKQHTHTHHILHWASPGWIDLNCQGKKRLIDINIFFPFIIRLP